MSGRSYQDASAFRRALEDRLRRRADNTGVPLDRLRKEVAHQRLLASLDRMADLDLGDYFIFEAGEPRPLEAETDEGGLRYSIRSRVDGREFERLQFDVNFV